MKVAGLGSVFSESGVDWRVPSLSVCHCTTGSLPAAAMRCDQSAHVCSDQLHNAGFAGGRDGVDGGLDLVAIVRGLFSGSCPKRRL